MSILNTNCSICDEEFKNSNTIQSTYCGHIFHKNCLDEWKLRRRTCPICQRDYGMSNFDHQLFLSLDDREVNMEDLEELKTKLQGAKETNDQLQGQLVEKEFDLLELQKQFTASENSKKELEKKIGEQMGTDDNFLGLQKQYTESTETIKELNKLIQEMIIENEKCIKELDLKCVEIALLKTNSSGSGGLTSDSVLQSKMKILEQKLRYMSDQLEKEIANSTLLSIEKMKLETFIETTKKDRSANNREKKHEKVATQRHFPSASNDENSLIIENFPLAHIKGTLRNVIIDLGAKMGLTIEPEDICQVKILHQSECQQKTDEEISLIVKFKTNSMKMNFLANKEILKENPLTSSYSIKLGIENIDSHSLFKYAKQNLINNGFAQVFCRNNKVFAKKHDKSKPLVIFNIRHVDNLVKRKVQEKTSELLGAKSLPNQEIDVNFYQL